MKPLMILIALLCVGCGYPGEEADKVRMRQRDTLIRKGIVVDAYNSDLERVKVGPCEYIVATHYTGTGIVHAGDCPNPKHGEGR